MSGDNFVINSKKDLERLMANKYNAFCSEYQIEEINFSQNTLLGKWIRGAIYCDLDNIMLTLDRNCDQKIFDCIIEINCPKPDSGSLVPAIFLTR